jgi:hypothetical protein
MPHPTCCTVPFAAAQTTHHFACGKQAWLWRLLWHVPACCPPSCAVPWRSVVVSGLQLVSVSQLAFMLTSIVSRGTH